MTFTIAHLGPAGTYAEQAALAYAQWWSIQTQQRVPELLSCPSIAQTLYAVAEEQTDVAVVPIENSIEGSVTMTLDTLWQLETLQIRQALVLPIVHVLVTQAELNAIQVVYSHPQALGQCQQWLRHNLPHAQQVPTLSTTDALKYVGVEGAAAIASERAAHLYNLPILAQSIQDYADNCTRFLVVTQPQSSIEIPAIAEAPICTSLAFSLPQNLPGALVAQLQAFAARNINLSKIESRPTKRSLGEYVFFIDAEAALATEPMQSAVCLLSRAAERLKVLGTYSTVQILPTAVDTQH
jgi:prephenate dehydratase